MSAFNVEVAGGSSVRLPTAGKYCERDIIVTATGGGTPTPTQEKTVEITKNGTVDVTPDDGYALSKVTANVNVPIPDGYIKPSGTLDIKSNGIYDVTEKANVLVSVPIREIYLQEKTIVKNGTYTADEGYDGLWKVTVNVQGGGGDNGKEVAELLENTMTELNNSIVTSLRTRACQQCTKLVSVNLPLVTTLGGYAFYQCSGLETVKLPKLTYVSTQVFYSCTKLQHADCGQLGNIPAQTFNACSALTELILRKTGSICTLSNVNGVNNTPIGKGTGYIYVPAALVGTYKTATNWSTYANQFRAIENYRDICG